MPATGPLLNRYLFSGTSVDSGSLGVHGAIMHQFNDAGDYVGKVSRGRAEVGHFFLRVSADCAARQTNIDLANLCDCMKDVCAGKDATCYAIQPAGYGVFHVSQGRGGFVVSITKARDTTAIFKSSELKAGDIFAVTLMRAGTYSVTNAATRTKAELVVKYPVRTKERRDPPPVVNVQVTANAIDPAKIQVASAQSHAYLIKDKARIQIELVKADDGPDGSNRRHVVRF